MGLVSRLNEFMQIRHCFSCLLLQNKPPPNTNYLFALQILQLGQGSTENNFLLLGMLAGTIQRRPDDPGGLPQVSGSSAQGWLGLSLQQVVRMFLHVIQDSKRIIMTATSLRVPGVAQGKRI